jgi:hypothetical protein
MSRRLAAFLALSILASPAFAQGRSEAFLDLASRLPAELLSGAGEHQYLSLTFSDIAATAPVMEALPPLASSIEDYGPYARLQTSLFTDTLRSGMNGAWDDYVGFNATDIETALHIWAPPDEAVILRLAPEAAARVAPTLLADGYAEETRDGIAALTRGEDFGIDLSAEKTGEPFGALQGNASRVVVEDDLLVQSNNWPRLASLLDESPKGHPSLPALSAALDDPRWGTASLLELELWPDPDAFGPAVGGLPAWDLAAAADLSDGVDTLTLALFTYGDRASAQAAADRLATAWAAEADAQGRTFRDITGSEAEVAVLGDGPFVTVLALRAPTVAPPDDFPYNGPFRVLLMARAQGQLGIFAPG